MSTIVIVNKSKCNPIACGNYLCMRYCPRNKAGDECIIISDDKKVSINEEVCISCNICVKKCPFNALTVVNTPKELKTKLIHQFSKNSFRLYGLPIPKNGSIIGLLGANGIGKSTAIKILSGLIKPNLGNYEGGVSDDEVIKFFKGTETQKFLIDLFNKKRVIAYKPQYVEAIPKSYSGTVKELLSKISNDYQNIVEELGLKNILNNDIKNVSGGELQRIAIAATLLKEANTYFFDEPSSYLDIKQRLIIAKKLRSLAKPGYSSFIVEHDLIMLDYMTDLVHVFYGERGAYGITSHPYTTREAINSYLKGYLQNENLRFRDKPITYEVRSVNESVDRQVIITWDSMKKSLGKFNLSINKGELYEGEVVGIVGANGTGKTTFARLLAGELKPDTGEGLSSVKISYKPQYIKPTKELLVKDLLNNTLYSTYKHYFRHLGIESLMNKKITELSGGELQRVTITHCLTTEADLYLLDEPSAHLDVEQRVLVAKAVKDIIRARKKASLIIDHDLMFIDYISERLLVFNGESGINGEAIGPLTMREGMNLFLKGLGITFRRDEQTHRPRPNKPGSVKDREQKSKGEYYYS